MRILVCGGRTYGYTPESNYTIKDWVIFNKAIDVILSYNPTVIISGCAKGADEVGLLAGWYGGVEYIGFKADWKKHSKAAGPIRNKQMLVEGKPDLVVAFKGGTGTANMIKQAKSHGVEVMEIT